MKYLADLMGANPVNLKLFYLPADVVDQVKVSWMVELRPNIAMVAHIALCLLVVVLDGIARVR